MKAILIVDGAYLMRGAKPHGHFDYVKLKALLERRVGTPFSESYYLNSMYDAGNEALNAFHSFMKSAPPKGPKFRVQLYDIKQMDVQCPQCGCLHKRDVQKGVDVGIATLVLKLAMQNKYDVVVLCAGDGDFKDAIAHVVDNCAKAIIVAGFEASLSTDLQSYAKSVIFLEEHWAEIAR
jgi:uncharacterized LabA/DUF88 family protein